MLPNIVSKVRSRSQLVHSTHSFCNREYGAIRSNSGAGRKINFLRPFLRCCVCVPALSHHLLVTCCRRLPWARVARETVWARCGRRLCPMTPRMASTAACRTCKAATSQPVCSARCPPFRCQVAPSSRHQPALPSASQHPFPDPPPAATPSQEPGCSGVWLPICMYDILQSSKSASSTQHTRGKYRKTG